MKNYKLNLLDILLVLAAVGAVAFFLTRGNATIPAIGGGTNAVYTMQFTVPSIEPFVAESINIGDAVVQDGSFLSFGTVTALDVTEGVEHNPNEDGVLVGSQYGDFNHIVVTSQVSLPSGALYNGLNVQGNRFGIGQTVTIRVGNTIMSTRISHLSEVN